MKVINISEFRKNIKKYAELAQNEKVIIHRARGKSFCLVSLDNIDETEYLLSTKANRESLERSIKQSKQGEGRKLKIEELWN